METYDDQMRDNRISTLENKIETLSGALLKTIKLVENLINHKLKLKEIINA